MLPIPPPISNEHIEESTQSSSMDKTPKMRSKAHKAAKFANDNENYDSGGKAFFAKRTKPAKIQYPLAN